MIDMSSTAHTRAAGLPSQLVPALPFEHARNENEFDALPESPIQLSPEDRTRKK
jgi:hypothetical protein